MNAMQNQRHRHYPQFTEEHQALRKTVHDWCVDRLHPHAEEWEAARLFPREIFNEAADLGLLGIRVPEEYGGLGLDWWFSAVWAEELAHCGMAGLGMAMLVQTDMATPVIGEIGTEFHKRNYWEPAVKGQAIAALGLTEPDAGSDVASIRTTAVREGDDYVINGAKTYITNGTRADFITLAVRTGEPGYGGISLIMFPTDTKGYRVTRKLEKVGNHCSDTAEIAFDNCRIPARNLLGLENMGFIYIMQNFQGERLVAALSTISGAQRCLDMTVQYCRDRKAFNKPLTGFQTVRHLLVQLEAEIEAGRQLAYRAVHLMNAGDEMAVREISMAKLICGELANRVADRCLQLHGGMGYMAETEISRIWRDARLITIGGGTSAIMREILTKVQGI